MQLLLGSGGRSPASFWQDTSYRIEFVLAGKAKRKAAEREELYVPPDLPIEMIAEEVKESWRLKEVHVEKLMQKVSCPVQMLAVL